MRIVSPFVDYYDFVARKFGGGDPRLVYNRGPITDHSSGFGHSNKFMEIRDFHWPSPVIYERSRLNYSQHVIEREMYDYKYLVVVGKAYLLQRKRSGLYQESNPFCIVDVNLDTYPIYIRNRMRELDEEDSELVELSRIVGAPVFVIDSIDKWQIKSNRISTVEIEGHCPILAKLGMASRIDPYQMYQELAMFLGNRMKTPPDTQPPVTLNNKEKILKAGFDLRQSFRHRV